MAKQKPKTRAPKSKPKTSVKKKPVPVARAAKNAAKKKPAKAKLAARTRDAALDSRIAAAIALALEAERTLAAQPATASTSAWLLSARPRRAHSR